jgi:hypothetical protein
MRKVMLLAALAALSVTGVAYGAVTVTNKYVLKGKITPVKSGTKKHPRPFGAKISYTVSTSPTGYRPNVVEKYALNVQGAKENTNVFPGCSTSRLLDPAQGPNTCPPGSKAGTGFFIAKIGPSNNQKQVSLTCRAELTLYNGSNHSLTFYVYKGKPISGQPQPCPLASPQGYAIHVTLKRKGRNLVAKYTVPAALLHPASGLDAAVTSSALNVPVQKQTITKKGKKVKVGLFETTFCPKNHQRQIAVTFTQGNGKSRTATRLVACK